MAPSISDLFPSDTLDASIPTQCFTSNIHGWRLLVLVDYNFSAPIRIVISLEDQGLEKTRDLLQSCGSFLGDHF